MTGTEIVTLLPLIVLAAAPVVIMLVVAFYRDHRLTVALTMFGLVLAFAMLPVSSRTSSNEVTALLILDRYALFYMGLIFAAAFAVAGLAYRYLEGREGSADEFYILLLLATLGSAVLVASRHFASFFLGLEILSVSLYGLIGYPLREHSIEAAIKYLILAAASAAFLLFGMALIYGEVGTMEFAGIASSISGLSDIQKTVLMTGFGMVVVGVGFKLAVVPFHMWTPDVYEGAPAPVAAFVASVSKGAMFALVLRFYTQIDYRSYDSLFAAFYAIAVASMLVGNLLALLQSNVKRILAYSSIAHLGYLLVAFLASGSLVVTAVTFYLVAYFAATLGSFGIITVLSGPDREADSLDDYRGLVWRRPWLATAFTATLLSLAGIPLTAGFLGKIYLVTAAAGSALWALVIILAVSSVIGLFYYLRVIGTMFAHPPEEVRGPAVEPSLSLADNLVLAVVMSVVVWLGVYPAPLIHVIEAISR